jgi:hypothetical protein
MERQIERTAVTFLVVYPPSHMYHLPYVKNEQCVCLLLQYLLQSCSRNREQPL